MRTHFPAALLACIAEDREPSARELAAVAAHVRREAFGRSHAFDRRVARAIAEAALSGVGQVL